MKRTLALALASAALALAACSPDFDPASKVDKLRVVAIRAEPPEIEPAGPTTVAPDRAVLTSLVLRADFDAEHAPTTSVVYLTCVPKPGDPSSSPCVMLAALRDPTAMLAQAAQLACAAGSGAGEVPDPDGAASIAFAGVEVCDGRTCGPAVVDGVALPAPEVAVPSDLGSRFEALRKLRPDAPELILGVQAVVLAFAIDATPDELIQGVGTTCPAADMAARLGELWASREQHVLATKRVQIRGPDAPDLPNVNPAIDGMSASGTTLDPAAPTTVTAGTIALAPDVPADANYQTYNKLDAAGVPIETTTEEWVYSWFSTAGEIDELHTRGTTADECRNEWTVSTPGPAIVAAVVRDLRGGVDWTVRRVEVVAP